MEGIDWPGSNLIDYLLHGGVHAAFRENTVLTPERGQRPKKGYKGLVKEIQPNGPAFDAFTCIKGS